MSSHFSVEFVKTSQFFSFVLNTALVQADFVLSAFLLLRSTILHVVSDPDLILVPCFLCDTIPSKRRHDV